jgi:hypothetical protein
MAFRFPAVEPYDSGMLNVGDGHQVYWEACGNADGRPAIYLHGGPGCYDVSSPLETAWQLSRNWSSSQLQIIENEGHGGNKFDAAVTDALNQFAAPVTRGL